MRLSKQIQKQINIVHIRIGTANVMIVQIKITKTKVLRTGAVSQHLFVLSEYRINPYMNQIEKKIQCKHLQHTELKLIP